MTKVVGEVEVKDMADRVAQLFSSAFELEQINVSVSNYIGKKYSEGLTDAEVSFDMNFVPSRQKLDFLRKYVDSNMKTNIDQVGRDLRGEISRAIMDGADATQLKQKVKKIFKDKKYANRMKTILRTEGLRANNYGSLDGAEQSGLKLKKYVDVIIDSVTSDICLQEDRKYGSKEKAIALDQEFVVKIKGDSIRAQAPPFHPNCRTVIRFVREKEAE